MVRRRRTAEVDEDPFEPPDELVLCVVEDWIHPSTYVPQAYEVRELSDVGFWLVKAYCLHGVACSRWIRENDVPRHLQGSMGSRGRPRFRDVDAFVAAVAERYPSQERHT